MTRAEEVRIIIIDINKIPEHDMDRLCRIIIEGARDYLSDPAVRADYEKWKQKREESCETEKCLINRQYIPRILKEEEWG